MDTLDTYRQIIQKTLSEYANIPYGRGDIQTQVISDCKSDHYLLMILGWESARYIHSCLIHVDIINRKVWIQAGNTEHGIARELVEGGIPKDQIVLGFRSPRIRKHTEFAVA